MQTIAAAPARRADAVVAAPVAVIGRREWALLVGVTIATMALLSLALRPLLPVDELRYVGVAWEMWLRGDFIVPHLNGLSYEHKPPLLFWLIHAGWAVFGVNAWWPRLIGPLCAGIAAVGLARLGARLWPTRPDVGRLGTLMLLSSWFIACYLTTVMFDLLLLASVAWGWWALHRAIVEGGARHWSVVGVALAVALLSKGPVALLYLLPPLVALRWWASPARPPLRAGHVALALAIGCAPLLLWVAAVAAASAPDYLGRLLVDQSLDRVTGHMGHPRPLYWYLPLLLVLPLPWTLWPPLWRGLRALPTVLREPGGRFVAVTFAVGLLALSVVGGKQLHYLIPLLAIGALPLARCVLAMPVRNPQRSALLPALAMSPLPFAVLASLAEFDVLAVPTWLPIPPWWFVVGLAPVALAVLLGAGHRVERAATVLALASVAWVGLAFAVVFALLGGRYDLTQAGLYAGHAQAQGRSLAYVGHYQGEFGFAGRLHDPVTALDPHTARAWALAHPDGLIIARAKRLRLRNAPVAEYAQPYKTDELLMFRAGELLRTDSGFAAAGDAAAATGAASRRADVAASVHQRSARRAISPASRSSSARASAAGR